MIISPLMHQKQFVLLASGKDTPAVIDPSKTDRLLSINGLGFASWPAVTGLT
jgi:hypothetical protein